MQTAGEVALEERLAGRALRELGLHGHLEGPHLRVAQEYAQQRPRQAALTLRAGQQLLLRGDRVVHAIEHTGAQHVLHEGHEVLVAGGAAQAVEGQGARLVLVVGQHQGGHLLGHLGQDAVALLPALDDAPLDEQVHEDLDVHLMVRHVDAAGVVHGVGVDEARPASSTRAALLREAQVAALGHHTRADVVAVHAQAVVGPISDLGVVLGGAFTYVPMPPL